MPSIKQPSPAKTYVLWFMIFLPNFFFKISSARAKPTAFAIPCPKGPVVVSIPEFASYSGCPAQIEFNCLKFFMLFNEMLLYPVR